MKTMRDLGRLLMILAIPALLAAAMMARPSGAEHGWQFSVSLTPSRAHVSARAGELGIAVLLHSR